MTDVPLEQRAGSNIGTQTSFWPRIKNGLSKLKKLVSGGDTVLFECPPDIDSLIISTLDFFNNATAPSPLNVQPIIVSPNGIEHPVPVVFAVPAYTGFTGYLQVNPLAQPIVLTPGEKYVLRTPAYSGGDCFVEGSAGRVFGGISGRQAIGQSRTTILEAPDGKDLAAVNGGISPTFPLFFFNSDPTNNHVLNIYVEDEGVDILIAKNFSVPSNSIEGFGYCSLSSGQKLKAEFVSGDPPVAVGKSVVAASFYMLFDKEKSPLGS